MAASSALEAPASMASQMRRSVTARQWQTYTVYRAARAWSEGAVAERTTVGTPLAARPRAVSRDTRRTAGSR